MNRITELFKKKKNNILSVYFTAGHPELNNTVNIVKQLERSGVDLIEIGIPFSDPLADGPVIQNSSSKALANGMSLKVLFEQLKDIRKEVSIPLLLMGYINPVYRYGVENFCKKCNETGIDGAIIPDLPLEEYKRNYKQVFDENNLSNVFLISPQTSPERVLEIDHNSEGFIYMVSSSSTTGAKSNIADNQFTYFNRIKEMKLKNPLIIGFGISNKNTFDSACKYANGAIIGSAFVKKLEEDGTLENKIDDFIQTIRKA